LIVTLLTALAVAHPGGHEDEYPRPKPAAPAQPATAIPATYAEVLAALRERATAIETAIDGFKIADLHAAAIAATDLAKAVPEKASAETKAAVSPTATHLQAQLAELVAKADKGDMMAAKAALALVRSDISALETTGK
jgi:hypothetical protein